MRYSRLILKEEKKKKNHEDVQEEQAPNNPWNSTWPLLSPSGVRGDGDTRDASRLSTGMQ
jgi:hypothetical protein